jgi:predicted nuclease of restriction endonuclease-like (RecB) superfamily
MSNRNVLNTDFKLIANLITKTRNRVFDTVNSELIILYWEIGKHVSIKVDNAQWGDKTIDQLADYIKNAEPTLKGFERRNIYRMKQFYETYKDNEIVTAMRTQLNWTQHRTIMSRCNSIEEKEFYIQLCAKEKYTTRELDRQIDSSVFERTLLSKKTNLDLRKNSDSYYSNIFRDQYILDFLNLPDRYSESDLQNAIVSSLKDFILEIGKDFSFVGQNYRLLVGNSDFHIDLLFYHRDLHCLVAFELKIGKFKPEYLGQLEFYLEALDREVKKEGENPSIGILLCRDKDDEVVKYALSRSLSPAIVSEYKTKLIPKNILKHKLNEFFEILESNENKIT